MATEKRLIDTNEVLEVICDYCPDDVPCPVGGCAEFQKISRLLTADAVEVVHGWWVWSEENECWVCSNCEMSALNNYRGNSTDSNYCPNCGADMRGDGNG